VYYFYILSTQAVQSFDTTSDPPAIENGIYLGNICALKFMGDFEFDLKKSRLEFKFGRIAIFGLVLDIDRAEAARVRTIGSVQRLIT